MSTLAVPLGARRYPVVLPTLRDPRLHLAGVIVSLQVLGQVAFSFKLSIAQILIAIGTCAVLEVAIVARQHGLLMWPASALLTGNGVAFVLRVPGTRHGDWWSLHGWWIFAGTAAFSLLSKYVFRWRGRHVFNPSNIGLVVCFLVLGRTRAEPLDFWWGPMSAWMALAIAIIVVGALAILTRLRLLVVAVAFWLTFAGGLAVLAATGHAMTARWHLGPVDGWRFWLVLATSPEILVFLFFMTTDPKTVPPDRLGRIAHGAAVGLLAALLVAPARTEFWAKVAVLGALAIVCLGRPALAPIAARIPRRAALLLAPALAVYVGLLVVAGIPARPAAAASRHARPRVALPPISILPSRGVDSKLGASEARKAVSDLLRHGSPVGKLRHVSLWLEPGKGQGPIVVARLQGRDTETIELRSTTHGYTLGRVRASR